MARRIAGSSVNWTSLAERVAPQERAQFLAFKAKSDGYLRRMIANPPVAPKIDWAAYKSKVPIAGMVDSFQKQYEALKIDYPADTVTSLIEAQDKQDKEEIAKFIEETNTNIKGAESELAKIAALLPFELMTMEDFKDMHPDIAWDKDNPTYFPHTDEFQGPDPEPTQGDH